MSRLSDLESRSIFIIREGFASCDRLGMLWSMGKDSTVLLWLARKAFFGHIPFPLIHIDTSFKLPAMIEYRDRVAAKWHLNLIYGQNVEALAAGQTFPHGNVDRISCCALLKTEALRQTLSGEGPRYRYNHQTRSYDAESNHEPFSGVIVGVRADEEGSRSKERYISTRDAANEWSIEDQPPELWSYYKTDSRPGTHIRIHPLLDWTELDIWEYVEQEQIPLVSLYYDQGHGTRYRSLGCGPCTQSIASSARDAVDVIHELAVGSLKRIAERAGRAQDSDDGGGLEELRRRGYM